MTKKNSSNAILGSFIKARRTSQKVNQAHLARLMGMSQPELSRLESGNRNVKVEEFAKAVHFLNLSKTEIVHLLNSLR